MRRYKRMTKSELTAVVADFASVFPDWTNEGIAICRETEVIRQGIWFEALGTGDYRPTHMLFARPAPDIHIRMLPQDLNVRIRQLDPRYHAERWPKMLAAMEEEFQPDIRKQLDMAEILSLCEAQAKPDSANDLAMLATLYAWLGHDADALECCERMQHTPLPQIAPVPERQDAIRQYGRELATSLKTADARDFLKQSMNTDSLTTS